MKKIIILLCTFSGSAFAVGVPSGCKYEESTIHELNLLELPATIEAGWNLYRAPSFYTVVEFLRSLPGINSSSSAKLSGPTYLLRNQSYRFKTDLEVGNPNDMLRDVAYYNSERGRLGNDRSNWDSNSYFNLAFNSTYGAGLVWSTVSDECSAKGVIVQDMPKMEAVKNPYGDKYEVKIDFELDQFSEAALDPSVPVIVGVTTKSDYFSGGTKRVTKAIYNAENQLTGSAVVRMRFSMGGGPYYVEAFMNDGNYGQTKKLGMVMVPGEPTRPPSCPTCNKN
ncbi:hypothetical protein L3V43_09120 [Pseudoalteromonas sp. L23]|uniref:hypothetical protein n=1 Tax=unclassified Pseudoalteromonas TaxID=194690 RepID=UPI001F3E9438|nr:MULTISPECIES: hypothetical protein [unclassified Pseudoalteromonas]MCF2825705.1 hypothetical protein [Pseudoalteromonas sp. OF5H-5]MCF2832149.1 hypothetical protein [Pseudoalteromonas sp. DL2-H6]MCF2923735.1 hypothetical protein [Pseudoalteromonas sp. DL2-H1]MCF7513777.1 hypothetical protein [Pseudoalteromonas sp. L7]MCF7525817.1 hypothetical protein [Pseudoalteromonas sp. L23]